MKNYFVIIGLYEKIRWLARWNACIPARNQQMGKTANGKYKKRAGCPAQVFRVVLE